MNDLEKFLSWLSEHRDNCYIYGTGEAARLIYTCVTQHIGFEVEGFIDRKVGVCCKKRVWLIDKLKNMDAVIIAANPAYRIENRLKDKGIFNYIYIDPVFLNNYCHIENYINYNKNILKCNISRVMDLLQDDLSKEIFKEMCLQRTYPCMEKIGKYYDANQYFGNDIIQIAGGVVVDCGAYDGDTLKRFLKQVDGEYKYFAIEADKSNCEMIKNYIEKHHLSERVSVYNIAAWDKRTKITLNNYTDSFEKTSGFVTESPDEVETIDADRIDNLIHDKVDLITMDIEGAEMEALYGAEKIITKYRPKLAISIYHRTDHLYKIPFLLHQLNLGYKLYIRHHRWNIADTVCYAV